jgi:hypothetical protein
MDDEANVAGVKQMADAQARIAALREALLEAIAALVDEGLHLRGPREHLLLPLGDDLPDWLKEQLAKEDRFRKAMRDGVMP